MRLLSNECLIEAYHKAVDLQLEKEFIRLLYKEVERRKLSLNRMNAAI